MADKEWQAVLRQLKTEIQSLDSKIRVVAQRMRVIEKNEQIIGKTLVNHNKKLKELERTGSSTMQSHELVSTQPQIDSKIVSQIEELNSLVKDLVKEINYNRELIDSMRQDINEMKYVLDTVNPMEYVTLNQVKELIKDNLNK